MEPVYIKINEDGSRIYYSDKAMTMLHRTDGPAIERWNGTNEWYSEGLRHRTDGPAIEYADGAKFWCTDGQLHRTDGPAIEYADGAKIWYMDGQVHRTDGPACEYADGSKSWYYNGQQLTEKEFLVETAVLELTLDDIAAKFGVSVENLKIAK